MAVSEIDTEKVAQISKNIISLVNEYDIQITNMFKMLGDVPYVTKEWVGNQSEKYFKTILLDKNDYLDFGKEIKRYAKKIADDSEKMADAIEKTQKNETKGN